MHSKETALIKSVEDEEEPVVSGRKSKQSRADAQSEVRSFRLSVVMHLDSHEDWESKQMRSSSHTHSLI